MGRKVGTQNVYIIWALIDSWFYETEYYLYTKADNNSLNSNVTTPIITSQLPSHPQCLSIAPSRIDCSCISIIPSPQNDTKAGTITIDHMVVCRKMNKKDGNQYSMNNTINNIQFEADIHNKHDIQHYKPIQVYLAKTKYYSYLSSYWSWGKLYPPKY